MDDEVENGESGPEAPNKSTLRTGIEHLLQFAEKSEALYEEYQEKVLKTLVIAFGVLSILLMLSLGIVYTTRWEQPLQYMFIAVVSANGMTVLALLYQRYMSLKRKIRSERAAMLAAADMLRDLIPTVQKRTRDMPLLTEMKIRLSRLSIGPGSDYFEYSGNFGAQKPILYGPAQPPPQNVPQPPA